MTLSSVSRRVPVPRHLLESGVAPGALTTVVAFFLLGVVPTLLSFETMQRTIYETTGLLWYFNPFPVLKYFGGFATGYVAVRFSEANTMAGRAKVALFAAVYGWIGVFIVWAGYNLAISRFFPPPVIVVSVITFINALWFLPAYAAGALFVAGVVHLSKL